MKRAVALLLSKKAVTVEESADRIRSVELDMASPTVIQLKYYVQIPYKSRVPLNGKTLMARDKKECQYVVNGKSCDRVGNTIDHVQPRSRGGQHTWTNTVACCGVHNTKKSDKLLSELSGWELKREPKTPSGNKWMILGIAAKAQEEAWSEYLAYA